MLLVIYFLTLLICCGLIYYFTEDDSNFPAGIMIGISLIPGVNIILMSFLIYCLFINFSGDIDGP